MIRRLLLSLAWIAPAALAAPAASPTLFSTDQLMAGVSRELSQHFRLEGELELELLRSWSAPETPAASWEVSIADFPGIASSNMLVRVRIKADGRLRDEPTLLLHACLWRDGWFARQPIPSGSPFNASLLDSRRIDAFRDRDVLPASAGDDSLVFSREIGPDRPVTWHDVTRRPLVHRGQVVEVTGTEGRLVLSMKGLAMENGARGDLITVRNIESRKDIAAIVVGDDRVEVHF